MDHKCPFLGPWATNPFLAPRCALASCTPADTARSPDWLQLRTGYILSSGSLSTVPKRESDDYSCGTRGARGKEKGEKMVGRVNACTKARLCIGIKDVSPHSLSRFFLPFLFSLSYFYFNPTTSSGTHWQHSPRRESHT